MFKKIFVGIVALLLAGCANLSELENRSKGLSDYPTIKYDYFQGAEIIKSYETSRVTKPYDKLKMKSCIYENVHNDLILDHDYSYRNKKLPAGFSGGGRVIDSVKGENVLFNGNFAQIVDMHTLLGGVTKDKRHVLYSAVMSKNGNKTDFIFTNLMLHSGLSEHPMWSRAMNTPEVAIKGLDDIADDIAECLNNN